MRALLASLVASLLLCASVAAEGADLALTGLDPTLLVEGEEVHGSEALTVEFQGFAYRFVSAENRARFEADPERYAFQWKGSCAAMPRARARGELFAVHDGKVFGFGSPGCREEFLAEPSRFLFDHPV
ncbi:MAG: hypothetical protein KDD47_25935, partial [Acidobacteria bacterium]|nr:hypothetical protein [Acidobacteriota bacterium]